jgi:hypothetical protein
LKTGAGRAGGRRRARKVIVRRNAV